ncbi:MAG: NAD(P)-dependent oxidoreductase [Methanobrevibacter sp.]|uniref:NAD(P)-binding domain-containing protein n=1 Tax=Methanobrevibacter sp. TaxID=66852 RepID=UPI001B2A19DA|nr:NAD(P)-binding domain-containing protein [Methanobrevibacter sp.]MBO5152229.1 NAD(P)-dependent oxidoreductase [Methanobrevibacter sp.]
MNIALIGFGKLSYNLVKLINSPNINFMTSTQDRSKNTIDLINQSNVEVYSSFDQAVESADIIISANSPSQAVETARRYGNTDSIYLDLNNISPKTSNEINSLANNFVDGAIIGKIDSDNPTLYLSGVDADKLLFLNEFLNVKIISDRIGDASALKLLRSTYTKSLSVLLIESYNLAKGLGLEDEFFDVLSVTEGDDFKQKSLSRISNTLKSSKRKSEELEEILDYFDGDDLDMVKTALDKLKQF